MFGSFQSALDECLINNYLRGDIGEFALLRLLHLLAHRFEVALHAVDTRRDAVNQRERLRVFCQHWREHAGDNVSRICRTGISDLHNKCEAARYQSHSFALVQLGSKRGRGSPEVGCWATGTIRRSCFSDDEERPDNRACRTVGWTFRGL